MIVVGDLGVLGLSARRPAEEELDMVFEKLNKKQNMGESHVLVVPTEQFLVINRVVHTGLNGQNGQNVLLVVAEGQKVESGNVKLNRKIATYV